MFGVSGRIYPVSRPGRPGANVQLRVAATNDDDEGVPSEAVDELDDTSDEPPDGDFGRGRDFHAVCGRIASPGRPKARRFRSGTAASAEEGGVDGLHGR